MAPARCGITLGSLEYNDEVRSSISSCELAGRGSDMTSGSAIRDLHARLVRPPSHERLRAGLLGAAVVWLWVFASDLASGMPLRTATFLGRGVISLAAPGAPEWASVVAFTIVHCGLWTLVATLLLVAVHVARSTPQVLMFVIVVFILLQLAITALTMALSQGTLGVLAWRSVFVGNALGWAATLWYIIRWHPELRSEFAHSED